jgi:hypothetical protein
MHYNPRSILDAHMAMEHRPWKYALKSTADSYRKKRKHDELFEDKIQEKVQNIL